MEHGVEKEYASLGGVKEVWRWMRWVCETKSRAMMERGKLLMLVDWRTVRGSRKGAVMSR